MKVALFGWRCQVQQQLLTITVMRDISLAISTRHKEEAFRRLRGRVVCALRADVLRVSALQDRLAAGV